MMVYQLRQQDNGTLAVFNPDIHETMHPGVGPWEEATRLYVGSSRLEARLLEKSATPQREVVVFDVGLGAAANALAAITCHQDLIRRGKKPRPLRVVSFENDLTSLHLALAQAEKLVYPLAHLEALQSLAVQGVWEAAGISWELRQGDFIGLLADEPHRADVVFFDPFSPRSNPEAWSIPALEGVYACRRLANPTVLVTYSSSVATRAALLLAGFFVGKGPASGRARQTTIAATNFSLLADPLDRRWLAAWKHDPQPWPCQSSLSARPKLRQDLLAHTQWAHMPELPEPPPSPFPSYKRKKKPGRTTPKPPAGSKSNP